MGSRCDVATDHNNSGAAPATVVETIRIFGHCTLIVWEGDTNRLQAHLLLRANLLESPETDPTVEMRPWDKSLSTSIAVGDRLQRLPAFFAAFVRTPFSSATGL